MKFITADQRTPEWYKARLGRATASRAKDIIAWSKRGTYKRDENNKYVLDEDGERIMEFPELEARAKYRRQLVTERIYGMAGVEEVYINDAMRWGMLNEDLARTQYKLFTGNKVTEEGFCIYQEENDKGELIDFMFGCSTDGLVNDDGNLEIKNLTPSNHLYEVVRENKLPDQFKDQVAMQLLVTGRDYAHFVGYDSRAPQGIDLLAVHVERDEEMELHIQYLKEEILKFLDEVERDFNLFLQYLPLARRTCKDCGVVFTGYLNICPECFSNNIKATEILQEPKVSLLNSIGAQKTKRKVKV